MHDGHRDRLRKKYIKNGLDSFEEHEVLELMLFYALPRKNTNSLGHELINRFGSIANVFDASVEQLMQVDNIGFNTAVFINMVSSLLRVYSVSKNNILNAVIDTKNVGRYVKSLFYGRIYEVFYMISLDLSNRVISTDVICTGHIDSVSINLREIINAAFKTNAVSVIFAHNHPGGKLMPSEDDKRMTKRIIDVLAYINVDVLDHIIVSDDEYVAMSADLKLF